MIDEPFAVRWARRERELGLEDDPIGLIEAGGLELPLQAAPFLSFGRFAEQPPLWEVFGIPEHWTAARRQPVRRYRMIGNDGGGDPFCIDPDGAVWVLDHEDEFRTATFVNTGVPQLAECLLAYFGETDPDRFRAAVAAVDPPALADGTFWLDAASALPLRTA